MSEEYEDAPAYGSLSDLVDLQRLAALMQIVEKGQSMPTDANYIVGEARLELLAINDECKANSIARAEAKRQEEAEALAAKQAELKATKEEADKEDA